MKKKDIASMILIFVIIISILLITQIEILDTSKWSKKEIIFLENNSNSYRQNIIIDKLDTIHLSWKGKTYLNNFFNIYYTNKKENQDWSNNQIISPNENRESNCLSLEVDKYNTIHITWLDEANYLNSGNDKDIFYRYKPLNQNWSEIELISKESVNDCNCPSISIKNENIKIIWPDRYLDDNNSDVDLYLKSKKISDDNWSDLELITFDSISDSLVCDIEEDSFGNVYVVWQEKNLKDNESNYNILYSFKEINGNWSKKKLISSDKKGNSVSPSIDIDSENTIHLIWVDNTNNLKSGLDYDVYYRSKKYNSEWNEIELISEESKENCNWPYIKIDDDDNIHIAWADKTNYSNGNDYDIVYKRKNKNEIWCKLEVVTIDSNNDSNWPRYDFDSEGRVHMTWWDDLNPNWIIYYKIREN
jgi:hypothetical protein